jgi:hypothetical protein
MKQIIFKAKAGEAYIGDGIDLEPYQYEQLSGVDCQDNFAEYSNLHSKLGSGYMRFQWEDGQLNVYTEYDVVSELTHGEIELLKEETQGQWSDGIGEGFEQYPCAYIDEQEVYLSPWFMGQIIETIIL